MDFYDWDENGFRDYKCIRCYIISSNDEQNLINTEVLIETDEVKIIYQGTV